MIFSKLGGAAGHIVLLLDGVNINAPPKATTVVVSVPKGTIHLNMMVPKRAK